jgi:hypothetical protein
MGKYRRNKQMMQRMYGAEALQEAFEGIMPQPIQIHNYIDEWLPNKAGTLEIENFKEFKRWCKNNDISRLFWKEVTANEDRFKGHIIAFKNLDDLTFATLRWK